MRIYFYFIGRPRDAALNAAAEEYVRRISRYASCEMREIRPERMDLWSRHPGARKILLDAAGKRLDSAAFAGWLERMETEGRELAFVVGGHDGLPPGWSERADLLLSLSPMTFPHELARAMLAEQVYRAFTILRHHPYPR